MSFFSSRLPLTLTFLSGLSGATQEVRAWNRKLSGPIASGGGVGSFALENGRVVFAADVTGSGQAELYGVPADGHSARVRLNEPLGPGQGAGSFLMTGDGQRVVFRVSEAGSARELHSAPTDGSLPATRLTLPLPTNRQIWSMNISPDGTRVVYSELQMPSTYDVFSVPIGGGARVPVGQGTFFAITPDSTRVVTSTPLSVAPLDGSSAPLVLAGVVGLPKVSADSLRAVYLDGGVLKSVLLDGSAAPVTLSQPAVAGGSVQGDFALSPDGTRVVYRQDLQIDQRFLLLSAPLDGSSAPLVLNGPLTGGGDVTGFLLSANGPRAVYRADALINGQFKIYGVLVDGSAAELAISFATTGSPFGLSEDGARAWFTWGAALAVAPVDGSAPQVALGLGLGPLAYSARFTADGESLLYLVRRRSTDPTQLYGQYANGVHEPVLLHPSFPAGRDVLEFKSGGSRVIYTADQDTDGLRELYSTKLGPPARSPAPTGSGFASY
jgi:hypothetical protein